MFFETAGKVFAPDGKPFQEGKPLRGWVALPADQPGLWSFESSQNQLVRLRNAAPFFAVGAPDLYFAPDIPWERKEGLADLSTQPVPATPYVPGAVRTDGNQALQLRAGRRLTLEAGPAHLSKDGGRFLPHHNGTIEFFMKPDWGTFTLPAKCRVSLLSMAAKGPGWGLTYSKNPKPGATYPAYSLYALFWREVAASKLRVMAYHRTIFEPGEWVHVAWVWGLRETASHRGRKRWLVSQLFVNGKAGQPTFARQEEPAPYAPRKLLLGGHVNMAVDELRVSDIQRYTGDYTPPSRHGELAVDEHTRALFHFNGNIQGRSAGHEGELPAALVKP